MKAIRESVLIFALLATCISCGSEGGNANSETVSVHDLRRAYDEWSAVMHHYNTMPRGSSDQERARIEEAMIRDLSSVDFSKCPADVQKVHADCIDYFRDAFRVPYSQRRNNQQSGRLIEIMANLSATWTKYLD